MKKYSSFLIAFTVFFSLAVQANLYVSNSLGIDKTTDGYGESPAKPFKTINFAKKAWEPGDTIFVMEGVYRNDGYGSGNPNNKVVAGFWGADNLETSEDHWFVLMNYPGHTPKIQFDGGGAFQFGGVNYVEIAGFEIEGPNQNITKAQALSNRLIQDNMYNGRGIAFWSGHHIKIHHNKVHDCPNSGIRLNNGDYIDITQNEVYNCTWWGSMAESALVVAQAKDFDTKDTIKIRITNNTVYKNRNYIPYYNRNYGPRSNCYGNVCQDYIVDGSGIYITRNRPGSEGQSATDYGHGWFYFANNVTYQNGQNGLTVHSSNRAILTNNVAFMNGTLPLEEGRGFTAGIAMNNSDDVYVYNNISWVNLDEDIAFQVYNDCDYVASNNIAIGGNSKYLAGEYTQYNGEDDLKLFVDTAARDFRLVKNSIAQDMGVVHPDLPQFDFDGKERIGTPDIGAFEYDYTVSNDKVNVDNVFIYPNPTNGILNLDFDFENAEIVNIEGKRVKQLATNQLFVDLSDLAKGIYVLKIQNGNRAFARTIVKR